MSDHLPECANWRIGEDDSECICSALRACEQRILDAAFEAVDRMSSLLQPLGPALVAIDALKGEQA